MTTSEQIHEIAAALAKAQAVMGGATKDSENPFFKSKYADLASVREACLGPLTANGIAVIQSPSAEGPVVSVVTLLAHSSGQWLWGVASCVAKDDSPQAVGSCISYLRRYALQSFACVAAEDDDAETAQDRSGTPRAAHSAPLGVDQATGEERPIPPVGYRYIDAYAFKNGWHDLTFLKFDQQGGSLRVSTKKDIGFTAAQAFADQVPVTFTHSDKSQRRQGEGYLDTIKTWKAAEPAGDRELEVVDLDSVPF